MDEIIQIGIAGACGRGKGFRMACESLDFVHITAVCDINTNDLHDAAANLGAEHEFTDYGAMLDSGKIDAVIIATPMPLHVSQAVEALNQGIHVLSEVPAGVSMQECRELVQVCRKSTGIYMMAENYTYRRSNVLIRSLVQEGLFGTPYFAEGEYIHELKDLNEKTPWRRKWQTGINGVTYGTHSLGPILQWMPGDRVDSVCCTGSGRWHEDPRGDRYENEATCVMLCRMKGGGLAKIRLDMLSDRPHAMTNYSLQGTDGCYESARAKGDRGRIWLKSRGQDPNEWIDPEELANEFLPDYWLKASEIIRGSGHGGGDYFEMRDFAEAIRGERHPDIGLHEAMDMTLPGLVSQDSIRQNGKWLPVPDSRDW